MSTGLGSAHAGYTARRGDRWKKHINQSVMKAAGESIREIQLTRSSGKAFPKKDLRVRVSKLLTCAEAAGEMNRDWEITGE